MHRRLQTCTAPSRAIRVATISLLALNPTSADAQSDCHKRVNQALTKSLVNVLRITNKGTLKQSFESWFFSEAFKQRLKDQSSGLEISVPFIGKLITFGGKDESKDAWTTWEQNKHSSKWTLDAEVFTSIHARNASGEALKTYLDAVKICYAADFNPLVEIAARNDKEDVVVTYGYKHITGLAVPIVVEFECSSSLSCTEANRKYKGTQLKTGGTGFKFKWVGGETASGAVTINTSIGSRTSKTFLRPHRPGQAKLVYLLPYEAIEYRGDKSTEIRTDNRHDHKCPPLWPPPVKALMCEGKFLAAYGTGELGSDPQNDLRDSTLRCVEGPCNYCRTISHEYFAARGGQPQTTGPGALVKAVVKCYSYPTKWVLAARVHGRVERNRETQRDLLFAGRILKFTVSKRAREPKVSLPVGRDIVSFVPGDKKPPKSGLVLVKETQSSAEEIEYEYRHTQP